MYHQRHAPLIVAPSAALDYIQKRRSQRCLIRVKEHGCHWSWALSAASLHQTQEVSDEPDIRSACLNLLPSHPCRPLNLCATASSERLKRRRSSGSSSSSATPAWSRRVLLARAAGRFQGLRWTQTHSAPYVIRGFKSTCWLYTQRAVSLTSYQLFPNRSTL